jgi:molecular chaperone GrpE
VTAGHEREPVDTVDLDAEGRDPQETAGPGSPADGAADPVTQPGTPDASATEAGTPDTGTTEQDAADAGTTEEQDQPQDGPEAELVAAQVRVAALTNDLQRLQAEYVNYKRRVDRDRELVKQNATFSALTSLLPVLDDIDRAREHGEVEGGFKAVADALERAVAALGLVKFGAPGDPFDPNFHEALMHAHSADVTTTTCRDIVAAGYLIGDRVVRPAKVTVVDPEPEA